MYELRFLDEILKGRETQLRVVLKAYNNFKTFSCVMSTEEITISCLLSLTASIYLRQILEKNIPCFHYGFITILEGVFCFNNKLSSKKILIYNPHAESNLRYIIFTGKTYSKPIFLVKESKLIYLFTHQRSLQTF